MERALEAVLRACKQELNSCTIKQLQALETGREKEELYYLGMCTACQYILNTIEKENGKEGFLQ